MTMALTLEAGTPAKPSSTAEKLVMMSKNQDLGMGWRLFTLKAKDAGTAKTLKEWAVSNRKWYGVSILTGIRAELQAALNKSVAGKNRLISVPTDKTPVPLAVARASGIATRKHWDEKNQSLHFWCHVTALNAPKKESDVFSEYNEAVPGVAILVGALILAFIGFWIGQTMKNVDIAVSKLESVTQPIGAATSSVQSSVAAATAAVTKPSIQQTFADNSGNPWLYVGLAAALLFGSIMVRQLRGAGRDLGGAVRSTNDQVRADLDDISDNPTPPSGGGSRRRR